MWETLLRRANHNLSFTLLSGKLKEGLKLMEWRWKNPDYLQCINIKTFLNLYGMVNKVLMIKEL